MGNHECRVCDRPITSCECPLSPVIPNPTTTIPLKEYESLQKDAEKLQALEQAGVDNWSGYDYAMEILRDWRKENGEEE